MQGVQKKTYLDLILLNKDCNKSLITKGITLDYLYGFEDASTAVVYLNKCLSESNCVAKMGLNCIYGILLAVEEYQKINPTIIIYKFINTLIYVVEGKIEDVTIENYYNCMDKILEFIGRNINFKSFNELIRISETFSLCEDNDEMKNRVLKKYCEILELSCIKLKQENRNLFNYIISNKKEEFYENGFLEESILDKTYSILDKIYIGDRKKLVVCSNEDEKRDIVIREIKQSNRVEDVECIEMDKISIYSMAENVKVLFLIDGLADNFLEILYLFGKIEGKIGEEKILACFYNTEEVSKKQIVRELLDRYSTEDNFDDKLINFLK